MGLSLRGVAEEDAEFAVSGLPNGLTDGNGRLRTIRFLKTDVVREWKFRGMDEEPVNRHRR